MPTHNGDLTGPDAQMDWLARQNLMMSSVAMKRDNYAPGAAGSIQYGLDKAGIYAGDAFKGLTAAGANLVFAIPNGISALVNVGALGTQEIANAFGANKDVSNNLLGKLEFDTTGPQLKAVHDWGGILDQGKDAAIMLASGGVSAFGATATKLFGAYMLGQVAGGVAGAGVNLAYGQYGADHNFAFAVGGAASIVAPFSHDLSLPLSGVGRSMGEGLVSMGQGVALRAASLMDQYSYAAERAPMEGPSPIQYGQRTLGGVGEQMRDVQGNYIASRNAEGNFDRFSCFVAGTLVHMASEDEPDLRGETVKPIESVAAGDIVWAWSEDEHTLVRRTVTRLFRHSDKPVLEIGCIVGNGAVQTITATPEHPFWIEGRGWVGANELRAGDVLKVIDVGSAHVARVVDTGGKADVYNFEVDGAHNYFVGRTGFLVHNDSFGPGDNGAGNAFTGIYVEGKPLVLGPETPEVVRRFAESTQQVSNYESAADLELRATSFDRFNSAEMAIDASTRRSLADPESLVRRQNDLALDLVREFWRSADLTPELREQVASQVQARDPAVGVRGKKIFDRLYEGAGDLHASLIRGEARPLTEAEQLMGVEALNSLKNFADALGKESSAFARLQEHVESQRVSSERQGTHHFKSPTGTDLRADLGSLVRDELGVPVMYGTSGGASDIASTLQFIAREQGRSMWADPLRPGQSMDALVDLTHHYMRGDIVPWAQEAPYQAAWTQRGAQLDPFVDPFNRYSHSYSEVSQATRMTLEGQSRIDSRATRSVVEADLLRLIDHSWDTP
jgi:hypothetical protein